MSSLDPVKLIHFCRKLLFHSYRTIVQRNSDKKPNHCVTIIQLIRTSHPQLTFLYQQALHLQLGHHQMTWLRLQHLILLQGDPLQLDYWMEEQQDLKPNHIGRIGFRLMVMGHITNWHSQFTGLAPTTRSSTNDVTLTSASNPISRWPSARLVHIGAARS